MSHVHLDIETRSACDLKSAGHYKYAQHPSTEVMCFSYCFNDGEICRWVQGDLHIPLNLLTHIENGGMVYAHNASFERAVLNGPAGRKIGKHGFPHLSIEQTRCTMAMCANAGIPQALEDAANVLGTHPKDKAGQNAMRTLCKPKKDGTWHSPEESPELYAELYSYCDDDVRAERDLARNLPPLSSEELLVYQLDQKINDRGVGIDVDAIDNVQSLIDGYKLQLSALMHELTGLSPSQTGKLAEWARANDYPQLTDLQVATVNLAVLDFECPDAVKRVLKIYSTHNMKAVSKYSAMTKAVCANDRIHGMFRYYGANTGRWSSTIVQLHNLFRPKIDDPDAAIAAFAQRNLDWIRTLYGIDPMKVFASCVRGMIVPAEGFDLLFPDYSGIETRYNAWLFDEEWKLDAFRAFDNKTGPDLYKLAYHKGFGVPIDAIVYLQRQVGKVMELSLGYQGGVNAFVKMVATYNVDLDELARMAYPTLPPQALDEAVRAWDWACEQNRTLDLEPKVYITIDAIKRLWRWAHPRIVDGWTQLEAAAKMAIENPGRAYGISNQKIKFKVADRWLCMRLPSGRLLRYFKPEIRDGKITYLGVDTFTRRYCRTSTYGGKLCENAVQAGSRDILVHGMFGLERAGYSIIGSVHDEVIMEIPEGFGSLREAGEIMCWLPEWAKGLPVAVEGHRAKRYRK